MGFQFIRVEAYGRSGGSRKTNGEIEKKWSAREVIDESERVPESCKHVANPDTPTLIYGVMPSQALGEAEIAAELVTDVVGRKLRKDAPIILCGVFSAPDEMEEKDWLTLRKNSVDFLLKKFGNRLRSVIQHDDESTAHCHFYVVPEGGKRVLELHPGHAEKIVKKGSKTGALNAAYKAGVSQFQDEYQKAVGIWSGLSRFGPKRRRLSRSQWMAEKAALEANKNAFDAVAEVSEIVRLKRLQIIQTLPLPKYGPSEAIIEALNAKTQESCGVFLQSWKSQP